jgi:hypothetical protein
MARHSTSFFISRIFLALYFNNRFKIPPDLLLIASVRVILKQHGITKGTLIFDESDRARSKQTRHIYKTHKQKHKPTGGYRWCFKSVVGI